jgi:enterochelin esterase family protein
MKKQVMLAVAVLAAFLCPLTAQQALWSGGEEITSPEVHENGTVTFRLSAPVASEVKVAGSWMPRVGFMPGSEAMTKDDKGVWSLTTEVLEPDMYRYSFTVDGVWVNDPNNPFPMRDVASIFNIFIVPGAQADLYRVQDVPHGSVTKRWYDSPGLDMTRRITIYTPPGYEESDASYPVLYLLHGAGGDEKA